VNDAALPVLEGELIELGALVPVDVEGVRGKRFVLGGELALLQAPPAPTRSVAFFAPFDSLLWDTSVIRSLFDFEYVWEGFFPPAKRRWGWYVLPIVFGDRLVGRIEPRIDRDRARVEVVGAWWQDGLRAGPRRRVRRRDARSTRRIPAVRGCWPPRVDTASHSGEAALPHPPVTPPRTSAPESRAFVMRCGLRACGQ
jgi:hypothetical protein